MCERFFPIRFNGRLDVDQFIVYHQYNETIGNTLTKMARTIQWFKENYKDEIKLYKLHAGNINLSGRQKTSFKVICDFINLYSDTQEEFDRWVNELINCHYSYLQMLNGNSLITQFHEKEAELVQSEEEVKDSPLDWMKKQKDQECYVDDFLKEYSQKEMEKLLKQGDLYESRIGFLKVLE